MILQTFLIVNVVTFGYSSSIIELPLAPFNRVAMEGHWFSTSLKNLSSLSTQPIWKQLLCLVFPLSKDEKLV